MNRSPSIQAAIRCVAGAACWLLAIILTTGPVTGVAQSEESLVTITERERIREALRWSCRSDADDQMAGGGAVESQKDLKRRNRKIGVGFTVGYPDDSEVVIEIFGPAGQIRRVHVSITDMLGRPSVFVRADQDCSIISGRVFRYATDAGAAFALAGLDENLTPTGVEEPVDPPFPAVNQSGFNPTEPDSNRIRVALVDSGVDYRQRWLMARLARGKDGRFAGYDFWDNDDRPFDSNPARSAFFPARHGTRVASVIVNESPVTELVPYRYPRSDMHRMELLIDDATKQGVRIMNLSLGSRDREQWMAFEKAAADSKILYIVSAGNDGSDLDQMPLFPASLELENMIVVTSANDDGTLARGSGFGKNTVDLLVAGEDRLTRAFGGVVTESSGSSFAAARLSAFAACLLSNEPDLSPVALKRRILGLASSIGVDVTAAGFLKLSTQHDRGACKGIPDAPRPGPVSRTMEISYGVMPSVVETERLEFSATLVRVSPDDWPDENTTTMLSEAAGLLSQCNVRFKSVEVIDVTARLEDRQISSAAMGRLVDAAEGASPRIFLMHDTLQEIEFGAQAIGRSNARRRPKLKDTIWITGWTPHPGIALAHELVHVLADSGLHKTQSDNLMNLETSETTRQLTQAQCGQVRNIGLGNRLLRRAGNH